MDFAEFIKNLLAAYVSKAESSTEGEALWLIGVTVTFLGMMVALVVIKRK